MDGLWIVALVVYAVTFWPTMLFYGFILWCLYRFARSLNPTYLLVALLPFVPWGYARWQGETEHARHNEILASIPKSELPAELPDTIAFDGKTAPAISTLRKFGHFRYVVLDRKEVSKSNPEIRRYDLSQKGRELKYEVIYSIDSPYLQIKTDRASQFWKDKRFKYRPSSGGPFELRYVSYSRDEMIALSYAPITQRPMFPPVLGISGWALADIAIARNPRSAILDFLNEKLGSVETRKSP